ncbi:hypothetical protein PAHAL_6G002600 [Panicum hallii]|jgi:MAP kinase substrate 1|uniref:VQ domain-containing protein n=1 Tax=Panicum hallii TaxID=206008 RepID=A0A2S3HZF6_9POAL|nr:protein MKS1-like [Panicum hallii]PAN33195.1 hypothetical protein PAHAL_6G002600 [Panicum hallii]
MEQYSSSSATTSSSSPSPSSQRGAGARELQGPRPAPLRVRTDSHKIRKPPPLPTQQQQVREPVIIYAVSPKVVHADPSEFRSVVQRLTGARRTHTEASSSSSVVPAAPHQISRQMPFFGVGHHAPSSSSELMMLPPPPPHFPFQLQEETAGGAHEMTTTQPALSPAARLAAIEQASSGLLPPFPSILSPGPLPAIQPSFFSPPAGAGNNSLGINLFGELISPAAAFLGAASGSISTVAGAIGQNPSLLQREASPSAAGAYYYWGDLFNNQQYHHQNQ